MEVTLDTKIYDLLRAYPFLEEELIRLNPKYKKLKNPILRRTIARVASVRQAAAVGGIDPLELLNFIRQKVGQPPIEPTKSGGDSSPAAPPSWIQEEPKVRLDANALLDEGKNPLAETQRALKGMAPGELLLLVSDFRPEPLIEEMRKRGYEVYSHEVAKDRHHTYIRAR